MKIFVRLRTKIFKLGEVFCANDRFGINNPNNYKIVSDFYILDVETLKLICEAKQITLSFQDKANSYHWDSEYKYWENDYWHGHSDRYATKIDDFSLSGFESNAQVFYRSVIDNNAYPDAVIDTANNDKGVSEYDVIDDGFIIDDQMVCRLITENPKKYEKIKPCPAYFKQYKMDKTLITHIKGEAVVLREYDDDKLRLEAITNHEGKTNFYLAYLGRA